MRSSRGLAVALLIAASAASLWAVVWRERVSGLRLTVSRSPGRVGERTTQIRAVEISSDALLFQPAVPSGARSVRWDGFWRVTSRGTGALLLKGREAGRVWLDGALVLSHDGRGGTRERSKVSLDPGLHALQAEFELEGALPTFAVFVTPPGGSWPDAGASSFFPGAPSPTALRLLPLVGPLLAATAALWLAALAWAGHVWGRRHRPAKLWAWGALLVVLFGGALRLEAVVRRYWGMEAPGWARAVAGAVSGMRPGAMKLLPADRPHSGDPGAYLRFAREMEGFYDAHVREPVFRLAVRIGLAAAGGSDVGVNLASAAFSTLLLWGTYALGSACFGGGVGFVAALLLAVEPMAIALGADGWRDDAFALFVLLSTLALVRLCEDPSPRRALWAGFAGAAACLTRITSLSFLLPGTAAVVLWGPGSRKARVLSGARALLVCGLLLAPYLATCAVVFGDPFVSINAHTQFYRDRASQGLAPSMSWLGYLATSFRPLELVGNLVLGLTVYPFSNKWLAYDLWIPHCSRVLEVVSLAGLLLFLARPPGRLLLLVLLSTLVPFAFTWRIPGGSEWRFTLVAYPFYLLAAALALDRAATTILRAGARAGAASGPR